MRNGIKRFEVMLLEVYRAGLLTIFIALRLAFNTVMTAKAGGNAALTLTESVLGSVLGPVLSTLLIQGYSSIPVSYTTILPKQQGQSSYSVVFSTTFRQLGLTLFLPLVRTS